MAQIVEPPIPPIEQPMVDQRTGRLNEDWLRYFRRLEDWTRAARIILQGV